MPATGRERCGRDKRCEREMLTALRRLFQVRVRQRRAPLSIVPPATDRDLGDIPTEELARELASRLEKLPNHPMHDVFYQRGFHLLRKHFYLPIPDDSDQLEPFWDRTSAMVGVDTNDGVALDLLDRITPFIDEFRRRFPIHGPLTPPGFYLINGGYMAVDAHVYYALVRDLKPRRIVEIGNGNSTLLAAAACEWNREKDGVTTRLTSIDPYPWDLFRQPYPGLSDLVPRRIQDVPLEFFSELVDGDMLFIDSSHVLRSGNDVQFEYLEILPRLNRGVMVHIHDISLPRPYPKVYFDNHLYWNEQYLLQAFLAFNDRFEVLWPGNHLMLRYPEKMLAAFPEFSIMREHYPMSEPTAFWMRVKRAESRPGT